MNLIDGRRHSLMCANAQALPVPDTTSEQITTGSVVNVCKLTKKGIMSDEKREQVNAKRRAAYHKKKEEEAQKLLHEYQPALTMSGKIV